MAQNKTIRIKRGNKANLPQYGIEGMPYFTMDTGELYIGMGDNKELKKVAPQQKIITFVYKNGRDGQFGPSIKFPYSGKIISACANCTITDSTDTVISIDKISEIDYKSELDNWQDIFTTDLTIPSDKKFDNNLSVIGINVVNINDYFRLNMKQVSNIQNIVIELVIELDQI